MSTDMRKSLPQLGQRVEEPVYFFDGVVMGKPDAHQAAFVQQAQTLHDGDGVVVAIPNKDTLFA